MRSSTHDGRLDVDEHTLSDWHVDYTTPDPPTLHREAVVNPARVIKRVLILMDPREAQEGSWTPTDRSHLRSGAHVNPAGFFPLPCENLTRVPLRD